MVQVGVEKYGFGIKSDTEAHRGTEAHRVFEFF